MPAVELTFPPGTAVDDATAALAGLGSALYRARPPFPTLRLSTIASGGRIRHRLDAHDSHLDAVLRRLRASLPSVRVEELDQPDDPSSPPTLVRELRLNNLHRPLRTDRAETTNAALLHALSATHRGERIEVRWTLAAARSPVPTRQIRASERPQSATERLLVPRPSTWHADSDSVQAERSKQAEPQLLAVCQIAVWTRHEQRAEKLVGPVVSALRSTGAPGVSLVSRRSPKRAMRRRFMTRQLPKASWPIMVNAAEATALIGWPLEAVQVPGLNLSGSQQLAPSTALSSRASDGAVIGTATFPGVEQRVVLRDQDRALHSHVLGPTGTGKTTLINNMILSDIARGYSVIVPDPGRDLITEILDRIPPERHDDVILLDPSDRQRPLGLNPLQTAGRAPDLVVEHVVGVIRSIFSAYWGPRSDDILRTALLTLVYLATVDEPATLLDVPPLLADEAFRRRLVAKLDDPILGASWAAYEAMGEAGRNQAMGPVLNKLRSFISRPLLRAMLAQASPGWSIEEVLSKRKILLVPLSAGELGEGAASLMGALLVGQVWQAAQARSAIPMSQRHPVMLHLDEFQTLLRLPTKLSDVLAQARKLNLCLTLGHQHLGQLAAETRADVLANARSRIVFQLGIDDARTMVKQLPMLTPPDLQNLPRYEAVAHLAAQGAVVPPVTIRTHALPEPLGHAEKLIAQSRERYGRDIAEVEQALRDRYLPAKSAWDVSDERIGGRPINDDEEGEAA